MPVSEPLPHFVDDLLGYLHETHPTHATLDGIHVYDDLLEDLSRHGIEAETRALSGYLRRLDEIDAAGLTAGEKLEHRMLGANLRGRMFELEEVRTWERNPQHYADIIASSLAGQALFTHAPVADRARRVLSKLRQTPRVIQAARDNIKDPPGIFVKVGIETMRTNARSYAVPFIPTITPGPVLRSCQRRSPPSVAFTNCVIMVTSRTGRPPRHRRRCNYNRGTLPRGDARWQGEILAVPGIRVADARLEPQ